MKRLFSSILNRMYCDFFKLYKIITDYINTNINDKKVKEMININNQYPIYKDLEPFKVYDFDTIENIHDVIDFDAIMVTYLNQFQSVNDYYRLMCSTENDFLNIQHPGVKIINEERTTNKMINTNTTQYSLIKPLLMLHALDDPILHPDTIPCHTHNCIPNKIDNFVCMLTETGGHVGWPVGLLPWQYRWLFMNSIITEFCDGITKSFEN